MTLDNEVVRARQVREMFGSIAQRYDFLNHFLSLNVDRVWRHACVQAVSARLNSAARVLDVGCGTADLSIASSGLGPVYGCDFCQPMLRIGREKILKERRTHSVQLLGGDALSLPFAASTFDAVVSAFVVRNLANLCKGLEEMRRVLRPGGVIGILDFAIPDTPVLGALYRFYFSRILPKLGSLISGVEGPYRYLPESVKSFPPPAELSSMLAQSGFKNVEYRLLTMGIAVLLTATADEGTAQPA